MLAQGIYRKEVMSMNAKEAVAKRITELCSERKMTVNAVANMAGISPSTIYSMLNYKSKNPGVVSLYKVCYGFGITLRDFFNSDIFNDVEFEDD